MANPVKAAKRSRRALASFSKKSADRLEQFLTNAPALTGDQLAQFVANQLFDGIEAWLYVSRAFAEEPPTLLLDADISGGAINPNASVDLSEPVAALANLTTTDLTCPTTNKVLTINKPLVPVPNPPVGDVERLSVTVSVAGNQPEGLYSGFIASGQVVQVRVSVWVHK